MIINKIVNVLPDKTLEQKENLINRVIDRPHECVVCTDDVITIIVKDCDRCIFRKRNRKGKIYCEEEKKFDNGKDKNGKDKPKGKRQLTNDDMALRMPEWCPLKSFDKDIDHKKEK